ncbi:MAG TPA: TraB/GumN family protein [Chitinophagaceae bacterium]|jgi:uncharacterized protein YbaP (TraB family)|nr:TraB/GumN family protein [Chitinophagaceae bacterium]HMU57781.1 TraB/GumN family protein [Chitinophagaceae bacterium]
MKKLGTGLLMGLMALTSCAQKEETVKGDKSLLWKISGNGLEKPSYLFGTIHMLCKEDANLGDNMIKAIKNADAVYLELDMDNLFDMLSVMNKMNMQNDTTLADLLTEDEYQKVKKLFTEKSSLLPFSMVEKYKPLLASAMLMESTMVCDEQVAMEQLIMEEAKKHGKSIEGMETTAYQMSIFDSIPYKVQAQELVKMVSEEGKEADGEKELKDMMDAYKEQDLNKLGEMISKSDAGMMQYEDILLNNRNYNWVEKLKKLMPGKSLVVAVGAGHLPGDKGVINLLRKAGFTVTPIANKTKKTREI